MKIYYDDDADIKIIKKLNVTIVGYGSQGHAHANNLKDSGVNVTVALREGSSSWNKAAEAGLTVMPVAESIQDADLVMMLAPDEFQKGIYDKSIQPNFNRRGRNLANAPALAKALTPSVPATSPPIPTAATLSPDL